MARSTNVCAGARRDARAAALLAGLLLWLCGPALLAQPASPPDITPFALSPAALGQLADATPAPEGADVHVLEVQESFRFSADGGWVWSRYTIYKVLTQIGAENWNELAADWSPWQDKRPTLRARVIGAAGREFALDPATLADAPIAQADASIYSDQRTLRAPLPAIAPGAIVETWVEVASAPTLAGAGQVNRRILQMSEPVRHMRLTLQAPRSLPLRYQLELLPAFKPQVTEAGDQVTWVFERGPIPAYEDEDPGLPRDVPGLPAVVFSTGASWQALAQAYARTVDERIAAKSLRSLAEQLTAGATGRDQRIAALMSYLNREIRYTGIEFDRASIIPHAPSETLEHRFGDCKDKATLLVALLRSLDIPANVALLAVGDRMQVPTDQPGLGMFDHAIVHVPGEPEYWIDATDANARLGELPQDDRGRLALVVDPATTGLSSIPWGTPADNADFEERHVTLANYGPASVVETSRPAGSMESTYRRMYADLGSKSTKDALSDYFKGEYAADKLEQLERSDPKDFTRPFSLTLSGSKAHRGFTDLRDAVFYIPVGNLFSAIPRELKTREATEKENATATHPKKKRTADYELGGPFLSEWHYVIKPPEGFAPGSLPPDETSEFGPVRYSRHFTVADGGVVEATLRAELARQRLTPAEQDALRDGLSTLLGGDAIKVKFELTANVLATQGKVRESFQVYRDLVREHPQDAMSHLRRAVALLDAGMGEAARTEARKATQLDPRLALAQQQLALILKRDLLGRPDHAGADLAGAAAAYRAAIAIDASDKALVANLAILLEYDAHGFRYGPGAHLKDAIAEYRRLSPAERDQYGVAANLSYALLYDGQFAEAKAAAQALGKAPEAVLIASDAILGGVPGAILEARRRTDNEDRLAESLRAAGSMLLNLRRYPEAADLLEAGAKGPTATNVLGLASMLRRTTHAEDLAAADTPEGLTRRAMAMLFSPDLSFEKSRSFDSANAIKANPSPTAREREIVMRTSRSVMRTAIAAGIAPEAMLDIAIQGTQIKSSGDDATGYRVYFSAMGKSRQAMIYLREHGQLKVLASLGEPYPVGLEVLDRVERGDLAGARTLLDWVREDAQGRSSDDPYDGTAFSRLWTTGDASAGREAVVIAAAALLVQSEHTAQRGVQILVDARKEERRDGVLENIDLALLRGYVALRDHAHALPIVTELAARQPASTSALFTQLRELCLAGRCQEAEQLARARLAARKDELAARRALAVVLVQEGRYEEAYRAYRDVADDPRAEGSDYNELAWSSLYFDRPGGPDLESAQHAVQVVERSFPALHTLACVYAELGRTKEAREVLLRALEVSGSEEPDGSSMYALGRIAEQYGEDEVALADYAKVTPPDDTAHIEGSTYKLARDRVAGLKARMAGRVAAAAR